MLKLLRSILRSKFSSSGVLCTREEPEYFLLSSPRERWIKKIANSDGNLTRPFSRVAVLRWSCIQRPGEMVWPARLHIINKTISRAQDPRANSAWLTEWNMKVFILERQLIRKQEGMVERLGEMRKGRRERIEKGSREGIEKETKDNLKRRRAWETPLY